MCAEAVAASGLKRHRARALLRRAEADLDRADSLPEHEWTGNYRRESFEHQIGLTLSQLGDYRSAEEHYALSVRSRRPIERRTKALIGTRLAYAQLRQRHPNDAALTLLELSEDLSAVSSARVRRALTDIRNTWRPFRTDPTVDQADHLLAGLVRRPAALAP